MARAPGGFRTWVAAVVVAAATLFVAPGAAQASGAGTLAADINAARAANGLGSLRIDGSLAGVAQSWANHMAATDTLAHNPSTPSQIRSGWAAWGENVGFTTSGSASELHRAFMASAGHRANILNPRFTSLGVGWATKNGHTYVAEVFAAYAQAASSGSSGSSRGSGAAASPGASKAPSAPAHRAPPSASGRPASTVASSADAAPTPVHPDGLVRGDTGAKVRALQVRLGVHGHAVTVDGLFGAATDGAVRAFQHDAHLAVDGIVGSATQAALDRPAKAAPHHRQAARTAPRATPVASATTPTNALVMARGAAAAARTTARLPLSELSGAALGAPALAPPTVFTASLARDDRASRPAEGTGGGRAVLAIGALLVLATAGGAVAARGARRRRAG